MQSYFSPRIGQDVKSQSHGEVKAATKYYVDKASISRTLETGIGIYTYQIEVWTGIEHVSIVYMYVQP